MSVATALPARRTGRVAAPLPDRPAAFRPFVAKSLADQ